jgi:hypothetical protein
LFSGEVKGRQLFLPLCVALAHFKAKRLTRRKQGTARQQVSNKATPLHDRFLPVPFIGCFEFARMFKKVTGNPPWGQPLLEQRFPKR